MAGEASGGPRGQGQQGREGQSRKARLQSQCRGGQEPHGEKQACRSLRWTCRGAEGRRSREGLATSTEAQVLRAVPRDHRRLMSAFRKPAGAEGRCSERGLRSPIAPRPPPPTLGTGVPLHTCFFFFLFVKCREDPDGSRSSSGCPVLSFHMPLMVHWGCPSLGHSAI